MGMTEHRGEPEREDSELSETEVDERPQQRREWSGPLRSVVLPIVSVAAIVGAIWYIERRDDVSDAAGGVIERPGQTDVAAAQGKVAPDFVLASLDGSDVKLSDFAGRPVFVNFWATWCVPCRKEMPEIIAASERYADRNLAVIAVNVQEPRDAAAGFAKDFGMTFPTVLDPRGQVAAAYRVTGLPTSYFIDRDGVIRGVWFGPLDADEMDKQLRKIL